MIPSLFADPVVTVTATDAMWSGTLHPAEAVCVRRAVAKRRREFTAGRLCARAALARLGVHGFPLLVGPSRVPVWPPGFVGSISHCPGFCAAAVARQDAVLSLGLDVERAGPLPPDVLARICTPAERASFARLVSRAGDPCPGKLAFSAKESFYKCYFPLTGAFLGFHDVEVELDPERRRFHARLRRADAPSFGGVREIGGRLAWSDQLVATGVSLPASRA
jgi:4'-phosphopantetheinyl transferase EntD